MPDAVIHPTTNELTAFALGKLPEKTAAVVAAHLESCPLCRQAVAGVPADSFLGKVRAAVGDTVSFPPNLVQSHDAPTSTVQPVIPTVACPDLPPELAHHPKYLILRELGRGGMGVVYQARHKEMDRQVVIKVINRALLDRPESMERFRREIRSATLLSHPNIVAAYDAERAGDSHMLVMEFVPGQRLAEVLEKEGPLPIAHACHFMRQVALGLQHAHERNMVHRDIKPQNLMLTLKNQVKILDFGLAKVVGERNTGKGLTSSGDYMGTPEYCAPEQAEDASKADIRADLYSLGCTFYCLLAGRPPFREDTVVKSILAHREKAPQPLPELRPDVPERLWRVIARLLAKEPAQRCQTPAEVVRALAPFVRPGAKQDGEGGSAPGLMAKGIGTMHEVCVNVFKRFLRYLPAETPAKKLPAKDEAIVSPIADLSDAHSDSKNVEDTNTPLVAGVNASLSLTRMTKRNGRKGCVLMVSASVSLALALILIAGILKSVKTSEGILVVEVNEPNSDVFLDGQKVTVAWQDGGKRAEIRFKSGTHKVEVKKEGFAGSGEEVTIEDGKRHILTMSLGHEAMNEPRALKSPSSVQSPRFPRRALVISIHDYLYANPLQNGLPGAKVNNLNSFIDSLNLGLHVPLNQIAHLSDDAGPKWGRGAPTKHAIEMTLTGFLNSSRPQDRILVFFLGHAVELNDDVYLAPIEGELDRAETLIPLKWFYDQLAKCEARQKVLVLDGNRYNQTLGQERPGGEEMGPKLDAMLKAPPPDVQVWSSCIAKQRSFASDEHPMGVFLESLQKALRQGGKSKIQQPDEELPLEHYVDLVNQYMKADLSERKLEQVSRLTGKEADSGAAYDPKQKAPLDAKIALVGPGVDVEQQKLVRAVLAEIGTPPIKGTHELPMSYAAMPLFPAESLKKYQDDPPNLNSPLRMAVTNARDMLWAISPGRPPQSLDIEVAVARRKYPVQLDVLKDGYRAPAGGKAETQFKDHIMDDQRKVAVLLRAVEDSLMELRDPKVIEARAMESKRWQANYDFMLARVQLEYAFLFEYQSMIASMRKEFPPRDPELYGGWKLASRAKLQGDRIGQNSAREAQTLLDKIIKNNAGSPWEVLAKREKLTNLGLEWQPAK